MTELLHSAINDGFPNPRKNDQNFLQTESVRPHVLQKNNHLFIAYGGRCPRGFDAGAWTSPLKFLEITNLTQFFMYLFHVSTCSERHSAHHQEGTQFPPDRHTKQSLTQTNLSYQTMY